MIDILERGLEEHRIEADGAPVLAAAKFLKRRVKCDWPMQQVVEHVARPGDVFEAMCAFAHESVDRFPDNELGRRLRLEAQVNGGSLPGPWSRRRSLVMAASGLLDRPFLHLTFSVGPEWYALVAFEGDTRLVAVRLTDGLALFDTKEATIVTADGREFHYADRRWSPRLKIDRNRLHSSESALYKDGREVRDYLTGLPVRVLDARGW